MTREFYWRRMALQLVIVAVCLWLSEGRLWGAGLDGPPASGCGEAEGMLWRFGPWGVVAYLVMANNRTNRRLVEGVMAFSTAFVGLAGIMRDRPCVLTSKTAVDELLKQVEAAQKAENSGD